MSHELRTPLNAVIGMSKMLSIRRFGPLTDKQADYLHDITQAGEHLLALINDILDLAKVEAGRMETQAERFPLTETIEHLLSTMRPLADAKGVALELQPPASDGPLHTDPGRFRQILYNLLSNAIKFTPDRKSVAIQCQWIDRPIAEGIATTEPLATAVRIMVRDTGIGIAGEDQAAIWEEFRQVRTSADDGQRGTGLGLALTRHLVQLLGGVIGVESALGEGSTFWFVIPRTIGPSRESGGEVSLLRSAAE
jgi:signal transduction histidine kinase